MRIINKLAVVSLALLTISTAVRADNFQKYYNDSEEIMTGLKKCNQLDPFSKAKYACLEQSESRINAKANDVYSENKELFDSLKGTLKSDSKYDINNPDYASRISAYKKNCENTYPKALQPHFATVIKECQVEVSLQRYFMYAQTAINF